jgi:hypothetical protein
MCHQYLYAPSLLSRPLQVMVGQEVGEAVSDALFHATGRRVRELPNVPEALL